jgi:hypothetical protein
MIKIYIKQKAIETMSHNTRGASRNSLFRKREEEQFDSSESTSSAEGARRDALRYGPRSAEDQAYSDHLTQEEADAIAAQATSDEADQAELDQEREDEALDRHLTKEETSQSRPHRSANRETANREAGTGQYLHQNILLQPTEEDYSSDSPTPTNVEIDECSNNIGIDDYVARANAFLNKGNIERRILSASTIFSQQLVINLKAADIVELHLSDDQKQLALTKMMEGPIVVAAKPAHSSSVNIVTTKV